ncbi:MAG: hypothetical protein ABJ056_10435 [Halioglobus sp.]
MKKTAICMLLIGFSSIAFSTVDEYQLEGLIGWTILASKTIEGVTEEDGERKDDFEGCDFGRVIRFMDGTVLTCNSYGYQYAFMPKAIVFGTTTTYKGKEVTLYKILVQGNLYDAY